MPRNVGSTEAACHEEGERWIRSISSRILQQQKHKYWKKITHFLNPKKGSDPFLHGGVRMGAKREPKDINATKIYIYLLCILN